MLVPSSKITMHMITCDVVLDRCTRTAISSLNFSPFSTDINWAMTSPKPNRTKRWCVHVRDCYQPRPLPFIACLLMWCSWWSRGISPAACCTTRADWTAAWARGLQRASGRLAATRPGTPSAAAPWCLPGDDGRGTAHVITMVGVVYSHVLDDKQSSFRASFLACHV